MLYFFLSTVLTEKKRESYREEVSLKDRKFSFCPHAVTPSPSAAAFFFFARKVLLCCLSQWNTVKPATAWFPAIVDLLKEQFAEAAQYIDSSTDTRDELVLRDRAEGYTLLSI